jgi:hypothetical protein
MKTIFFRSLILILLVPGLSFARFRGNESGGGGDDIRAQFLNLGAGIIDWLGTEEGKSVVASNQLSVPALKQTLSIDKITVVDQPLTDRTGSVVDALVVDGHLSLKRDRWQALLDSGNDIRYLVFHEMLRLSGVNDDNYVISSILFAPPKQPGVLSAGQGDPSTMSGSETAIFCNDAAVPGGPRKNELSLRKLDGGAPVLTFKLAQPNVLSNSGGSATQFDILTSNRYVFTVTNVPGSKLLVEYSDKLKAVAVMVSEGPGKGTLYRLQCEALRSNALRSGIPVSIQDALDHMFSIF